MPRRRNNQLEQRLKSAASDKESKDDQWVVIGLLQTELVCLPARRRTRFLPLVAIAAANRGLFGRHGECGCWAAVVQFREADEGRMRRGHDLWLASLKWVSEGS
jgi:hypothetical protein